MKIGIADHPPLDVVKRTMLSPTSATIDPNGVIAPLVRAVQNSVETVGLALSALKSADLSAAPVIPDVFFQHSFKMEVRDSEERKATYTAWLLEKGYQELARATREMLEEAYLYVGLYKTIGAIIKHGLIWELRKRAGRLPFPVLLAKVNEGLLSPLIFAPEMQSLQDVRNCLEHRGGVVGEEDLDTTGKLRLMLPALVAFAQEDGGDVELYAGYYAKQDTNLVLKRVIREREYGLGDRVVFTPQEFSEIANSCWLLSQSLLAKLPHPSREAT